MGSGKSGLYQGTFGSSEESVGVSLDRAPEEQLASLLVGDSVVRFAYALGEVLLRGVSLEEAGFPDALELTVDVLLDVLNFMFPGEGSVVRAGKLGLSATGRAIGAGARIEENARKAAEVYRFDWATGFFGDAGNRGRDFVREIRAEDPVRAAFDLFLRLSEGGYARPLADNANPKNIKGVISALDDAMTSVRIVTKTADSPAVEITNSLSEMVKNQKIHFREG